MALQRRASSYGTLFVVDEAGVLHGTFKLAYLAETAFGTELDVEHDLGIAMQSMQTDGEDHIVLVDDHASQRFLGVVHQRDVTMAYRRTVLNARDEETDSA